MTQTPKRTKLTDIINSNRVGDLQTQWNSTEATSDFSPVPPGMYTVVLLDGELKEAKTGTPGFKVTMQITDGPHRGRYLWLDLWLTLLALPRTKRDLAKLGITKLEQLEKPLPDGIICEVDVVVHTSDDGTSYNKIRRLKKIGQDPDAVARLGIDPDFGPDNAEASVKNDAPAASGISEEQGALIETSDKNPPSALEAGR